MSGSVSAKRAEARRFGIEVVLSMNALNALRTEIENSGGGL